MVTWKEKKLGDIAEIRMCKRIFAEQTTPTGEIPFFKIGTFGKEPDAYISRSLYDEYKSKYSFPNKGDILLSAAGTLGRTVVYDGKPAYFQDSNIVWLEIDEEQICNGFLHHCYQVMVWASPEGSTISRLYNGIIRDTDILLPPLPEQRRIAAALSDTDALITALERLIAKKRAIKQGAMQELLTGKRRLPGFEGEWVETTVDQIADVLKGSGLSKSKISHNGCSYCILYGELFTKYKEVIRNVVSKTECEEGVLSQKGDILIPGSTTTTGIDLARASAIMFDDVLIGGDVNIIRPQKSKINSNFLAYYITNTKQQEIAVRAKGVTVYHLHGKDILDLTLYLPSGYKEQSAIAEILSDMDAEIDALTAKLNKLRGIKQGMMSELLTGRIRLVEQDATVEVAEEIAPTVQAAPKGHNQQFDDAVMIAGIVNVLYSDKFPLGRKKVQKCLYLLRRYQDESTAAFKKKAAGPYADEVRYKGGEPIAKSSKYITTTTAKKGTTFACGDKISQALGYIESWDRQSDIQWVADNLRFKKVDDLELLATVDMAICDLTEAGTPVTVQSIKHLIATNAEWKAKLKKQTFSDENIAHAMQELQTLLQGGKN